jgi:hypothetical protein
MPSFCRCLLHPRFGRNGVSTQLVTSHLQRLHGFFGPKFQTGSGPFRVFVTGKVGFENFSVTNDNATTGFTNSAGLPAAPRDLRCIPAEVSRRSPVRSEFEPKSATTFTF